MVKTLELASHHFIGDPFSRLRLRNLPALRGSKIFRLLQALHSATVAARIVSTGLNTEYALPFSLWGQLHWWVVERAAARVWKLKESVRSFWKCRSVLCADGLHGACRQRVVPSRLEPMKKFTTLLPAQQKLLVNWLRARGVISSYALGVNKIRVVTRRAPGFRGCKAMVMAGNHDPWAAARTRKHSGILLRRLKR